MSDPLLTLLATIERLDREATKAPWREKCGALKHYVYSTDAGEDFGVSIQELHWHDGREVPAHANGSIIAFSRNTLAPLASMLRTAVEALEPFARYAEKMKPGPLPDTACVAVHHDNVNGDTEITIADLRRARAALATIRRMAEEVERG